MHTLHYFVHIPKTAGVTVRTWLRQVYARDEVIFVYDGTLAEAPDALSFSRPELLRRVAELPASLRVLFGHYAFDTKSLLHDRCRALSIVRDPRARVLSWQRYVQKNGRSLSDPMLARIAASLDDGASLVDACAREGGVAEIDNGIVRMFANITGPAGAVDEASVELAKARVEQFFDYVGHVDWFEHSMQRIADVLGRPYAFVPSKNESAGGRSEQLLAGGGARRADVGIDEQWLAANTRHDEALVAWLRERFPPPDGVDAG